MRNKPFQCKRDKMYTMSAIDPTLIMLVNIYADQFGERHETSIYNNGVMQISVFVSVNYNGDASEDEIIAYVQKNVVIYSLTYGEDVKWTNSTIDNGFLHDIDHDANRNAPKLISDIRVPLYFTAPAGTGEGEHKWIAKLGGKQTNDNTPLTITVKGFDVSEDDFEIVDRAEIGSAILRVLRYKDGAVPDLQKLLNCTKYKGVKFTESGGNTWVSMAMSSKGHKLGVFVEYLVTRNIKTAIPYHYYKKKTNTEMYDFDKCGWDYVGIDCYGYCLEDTMKFGSDDVKNAWKEGVVMIMLHDMSIKFVCKEDGYNAFSSEYYPDFDDINTFDFQDTFGSRVRIKINWDNGDWWGSWAVESAKAVYP